jgi:hypothetical protein
MIGNALLGVALKILRLFRQRKSADWIVQPYQLARQAHARLFSMLVLTIFYVASHDNKSKHCRSLEYIINEDYFMSQRTEI